MRRLIAIAFSIFVCGGAAAATATPPSTYDQAAVVTKRLPPKKSFSSRESVYCCVTYDVSVEGRATNNEAPYCTNMRFSKTTIKTLKSWRFDPALKDGTPVQWSGGQSIITSLAVNRSGYPKPGKDGFLEPRDKQAAIPKPPQDFVARFKWKDKYFDSDKVCPTTAP